MQSAEEVASAVWKFFGAAGSLIDGLDKDDDLRLLRLRTKKNELVIVPGNLFTGIARTMLIEKQIPITYWF
jgi:dynein light chain roadblock-type